MKILIAGDTYHPHVNGASYFTQRLAHYLKRRGHDVRVIAPSQTASNTDEIINGIRVHGIRSFPVFFYSGFRFSVPLSIKPAIKKVVEQFNPDIIHLQMHFVISREVLTTALRKKIPVVATNHFMPENLVHYVPFYTIFGDYVKRAAWWDFGRIFKKVGEVTSPTETAAKLIQGRLTASVKAISCGIDLKRFSPKNNGEHLKKIYKIPGVPLLLYVGRLDKDKNLNLVLKAFKDSLKSVKAHFVIAGKGAEKNNLLKLAEELGIKKHVTFTGFVSDEELPNLYAIADCVISPGTAELQSISTMEAMATGLPVIAVNAMALPELVGDGENGFLYSDGDVKGLSGKIVRIFSDERLRKQMGKKSLEIIAKHDIENVINEYERIYELELRKNLHEGIKK